MAVSHAPCRAPCHAQCIDRPQRLWMLRQASGVEGLVSRSCPQQTACCRPADPRSHPTRVRRLHGADHCPSHQHGARQQQASTTQHSLHHHLQHTGGLNHGLTMGNRIVVLDNGRVAELDEPGTLISDPHSAFHHLASEAGLVG
jgi:hypothetical protein